MESPSSQKLKVERVKRVVNLATCYDSDAYCKEAGVDEVARGCLFGPVYAAAVILNPTVPLHEWLNDSKLVTPRRRAVVREWIERTALAWSVGSVSNTDIDRIGIGVTTMEAMSSAIASLSIQPDFLIVDGSHFYPHPAVENIKYTTVVGGDGKYASIAAASILAKEHHDEFIRNMITNQPDLHTKYDVGNNVGYHSKKHAEGLRTHGASKYHRMTFLTRLLPPSTPYASIRASRSLPVQPGILFQSDDDEEDEEDEEGRNGVARVSFVSTTSSATTSVEK